jgi:hypothetical protein
MRLAAVPASCSHSPSARPWRPLTSAVVFGAAYATIVAIAVISSTKVFAEHPSAGLAAPHLRAPPSPRGRFRLLVTTTLAPHVQLPTSAGTGPKRAR